MLALSSANGLGYQALMDMFDNLQTQLSNRCLSPAGLAIGSGSTAKVKIVNTVTYLCDTTTTRGVFASKTTAEVAFTATTMDIAANASTVQEACYLLTLSSGGTPTLTMGSIASGAGNAKWPERPATGTPIGGVRIAVAAGSTIFDASTDALSAGHLTVTYYDFGTYGPRFDGVQ